MCLVVIGDSMTLKQLFRGYIFATFEFWVAEMCAFFKNIVFEPNFLTDRVKWHPITHKQLKG